jgi:exosortase
MASSRDLRLALVVAAAIVAAYGPVLVGLVKQWDSDQNYSHGFFVVPLALYFTWERRKALASAVARPHSAGLFLIVMSLLVYLAGVMGAELFLTRVSLIGLIAGSVLFLVGAAHLRLLLFPIAFLLLMIPPPAVVFNQLALPLQLFASRLGEGIIAAAGVPVLRDGNVLHLPSRSLEVVEACSGIRSLISLLMLALVLGYFTDRRIGVRIALAVAAVPLAIVANALRVAGTGITSEWVSPSAADGFFHMFSGWLMFVFALLGLVLLQRALLCIGRRREPSLMVEPVRGTI